MGPAIVNLGEQLEDIQEQGIDSRFTSRVLICLVQKDVGSSLV